MDGQTRFEFTRCGGVPFFFFLKKKKTFRKRSDKPVLIVVIQLHRFRVKFANIVAQGVHNL